MENKFFEQKRVQDLFEEWALIQPQSIAVICGDQSLSYGELNSRANQLAGYLLDQHNLQPETLVGVCLQRSLDLVVALLAILKAGGAYVPLDPNYPKARLDYMLQDADLGLVLTATEILQQTSIKANQTLCLDGQKLATQLKAYSSDDFVPQSAEVSPDHLVYVVYTSGSTGRPKGVMVTHGAFVNLLCHDREEFKINAESSLMNPLSFGFDAGNGYLWNALCAGACLHLVPADGQVFSRAKQQKVSHLVMPSSLIAVQEKVFLEELQVLICGGDAFPKAVLSNLPCQCAVYNVYGPSETTVTASCARLSASKNITIGKPIRNVQFFVCDSEGALVAPGIAGELYIGGVGLARGYLNQPELTAQKFIPNLFSADPHGRLYKTGDIVRCLPDGNFEFCGRIDHQVKIRGHRIELGEIESTLLEYEEVDGVVVLAREVRNKDKQIIAYVVSSTPSYSDKNTSKQEQRLRMQLQAVLPHYMVPVAFVFLDGMPLTINGKVDRDALPIPDMSQYQSAYVAPETQTEQVLCEIWQDLLGLEKIGLQDNFFQLGGHSLLATKLMSCLQGRGFRVDVSQVFSAATLADLANALDDSSALLFQAPPNKIPDNCKRITPDMLSLVNLSERDIDQIASRVPGGVSNIKDVYPLSPLQEGILFHHRLETDRDPYVLSCVLVANSYAHRAAYLQALQQVIDRHDILRTAVLWKDRVEALQIVYRKAVLSVEEVNIPSDNDAEAFMTLMAKAVAHKMNLEAAPLMQIQIARDQNSVREFILFKVHHLVGDHVGLALLQSELEAHLDGRAEYLPIEIPYREFVAHALYLAHASKSEKYFCDKLGGFSEATAPYNIRNIRGDGSRLEVARARLSFASSHEIRKLSKKYSISPASFIHLAWAMVLSACSGREDVVFGTVLSGRLQGTLGADTMMGLLINCLPIRLRLNGFNVLSALQYTYNELTELLGHEQTPLMVAQSNSAVEQGVPLFTSVLNYHHSSEDDQIVGSRRHGIATIFSQERTSYPFSLSVDDLGDGFILHAQVDDSLHAETILAYMQSALDSLTAAVSDAPQSLLTDISVLSTEERYQQLVEWNATDKLVPHVCIHELFERCANATPTAPALVFEDKILSYAELNCRANQLANYLKEIHNIRPDTLVGVCLDRSLEMVVALLGILKAGGAYVPMDPSYPEARLEFILEDTAVRTVLTTTALSKRIAMSKKLAVCLDNVDLQTQLNSYETKNLNAQFLNLTPANLAYVIYTSGSTGAPKGVIVEHKSLVNLVCFDIANFELTSTSRMMHPLSLSFDAGGGYLWDSLCAGSCLDLIASDDQVLRKTEERAGTHIVMPSALLYLQEESDLSCAQVIITGGETPAASFVKKIAKQIKFFNVYGPTEATVTSTCAQLLSNGEVSIGKPIANAKSYVLGKNQQLLPVGVSGELYIGGLGLARGYLNNEKLTAEKFINNPFSNDPDSRLYRTGDLVRWLPDGNLEFLGRIDHQVKIRGFRIELGEVETALLAHVKEAVVVAREDQPNNKYLVAYIVAEELLQTFSVQEASAQLREALQAELPEYMVPSAFVFLDALPLTPHGKVDRKALPSPDMSKQQSAYVAPQTETEQILCEIWQGLLGIDTIGVQDNFFWLGGHSLTATRMVSQVNQRLGIELPLRAIFEAQTLLDFARKVDQSHASVRPPIMVVARDGALALSYAQQRLWLLEKIDGGSTQYNMPAFLRLRGAVDVKILTQCFTTLIHRHESLRTVFAMDTPGEPYQVIQAATEFVLSVDDLSYIEKSAQAHTAETLMAAEARKSFDLSQDVMLRARLLICSEYSLLLISMHHIASDGWSIGVLIKELNALYQAYAQGNENPLNPLTIQYADYAQWQREWLQAEVLNQQLSYWQTQLKNLPVVHSLPLDHARGQVQSFAGAHIEGVLNKSLHERLLTLCQSQGATLFMGLHAAFSILLSRYSNERDIIIGTSVANREQVEVAELIGFFVNTLVLRSDLNGSPHFIDVLKQSQGIALDAYAHQQVPFEQLVSVLQPSRDLSHSPLFQVMLVLQNNAMDAFDWPGLEVELIAPKVEFSKYDLTLNVLETTRGLSLHWEYNRDLFEASTIQRLSAHFEYLLEKLITHPTANVFQVDILSEQERYQQVVEWNATDKPIPDNCIHELFEQWAHTTPDAPAVIFENQTLSYAELNNKANRLAHYLKEVHKVQPDTLVGVCLDRSLEMVIALLGILKAGGAYVPLDPTYPEARLAFMLEDAQCSVVITQVEFQSLEFLQGQNIVPLNDYSIAKNINQYSGKNSDVMQENSSLDNLAYVIYTSGSTGKPKGVMIEHLSLSNFLASMSSAPGFTQKNSLLAVTSISFDIHTLELFLPLMNGGQLILASEEDTKSPAALTQLIEKHEVNMMQATPATWKMLINDEWSIKKYFKALCGGEAWGLHLKESLERSGVTEIWNMYGPTETAVWSAAQRIEAESRAVSIGTPLLNTKFYILGSEQELLPIGVAGELHIGGVGLARGYLNNAQMTQDKFIVNPLKEVASLDSGSRLYKTGDLAKRLSDGNLEFLGRIDHQVKIRGFRIELGEIEAALLSSDTVKEAVVVVREDQLGDKRLVAYVVAAPVENKDLMSLLRSHVQIRLPEYMLPNAFVFLDALPLTANGKVDRKALTVLDITNQQLVYVAPRTKTEEALCQIWQELLGLERVGVQDNFFQLGGDSLMVTRFTSRARQVDLFYQVRDLFHAATIAELATLPNIHIKPEALNQEQVTSGDIPLIAVQKRFLEKRFVAKQWVFPERMDLRERIFTAYVDKAANILCEHHDAFRTRYKKRKGVWSATVHPVGFKAYSFECVDLSSLDYREQQKYLQKNWYEARVIEDFENQPLFKIFLFERGEGIGQQLQFFVSHLFCDKEAISIIVSDFHNVIFDLQKNNGNRTIELVKTDSSMRFANVVNKLANSSKITSDIEYWRTMPWSQVEPIPLDFPENKNNSYASICESDFLIGEEETKAFIVYFNRKNNRQTIEDALVGAIANAICKWSGSDYFQCKLSSARGLINLLDEVVDFSNTVAWTAIERTIILPRSRKSHMSDQILETMDSLKSIPNNGLSFDLLKYKDSYPSFRDEKIGDNGDILINYVGIVAQEENVFVGFAPVPELPSQSLHDENYTCERDFRLLFKGGVFDGKLFLACEYSSNLHKKETIDALMNDIRERLLSAITV